MGTTLTIIPHQDENSRLLFDDAHANQYGSFGDQNTGIVQADPQELQRENEALQKIVAQTSKYVERVYMGGLFCEKCSPASFVLAVKRKQKANWSLQSSCRYFCNGSSDHAATPYHDLSCPRCQTTEVSGSPCKDVHASIERYNESALK